MGRPLAWENLETGGYFTFHPMTGEEIPMPTLLYQIYIKLGLLSSDTKRLENDIRLMQDELTKIAGQRWDKKNS